MAVETVGGVISIPLAQLQNAGVGQEDLFKILINQLTYQDPLKPMDNQEFIAQLAQFTNLEQSRQLNEKLDAALTIQSSDQAIGLIGKKVDVGYSDGRKETGDVIAIRFEQGVPRLSVKSDASQQVDINVSLSQISLVTQATTGDAP